MTNRGQWTLIAGVVMTAAFGTALAIRLRPQIAPLGVGSDAPGFHATDLRTSRPTTLADYRGKVVLLNVWATWCLPCRVEMPSMERLHRKLAGTDFRILAVSIDQEGADKVMAFAGELGLTFDILHDPSGAIQGIYQTTGVPESFVIARDGAIVKKVIGAAEWDGPVNEALIRRLLDAR
jgi:cytochrome c biogenesis protein CcmG, thiol:disulfide interchange protein DsbE